MDALRYRSAVGLTAVDAGEGLRRDRWRRGWYYMQTSGHVVGDVVTSLGWRWYIDDHLAIVIHAVLVINRVRLLVVKSPIGIPRETIGHVQATLGSPVAKDAAAVVRVCKILLVI